MNTVPLEQLTMDAFSKWLKTRFRVLLTPADAVELELVEVMSPPLSARNPGFESFSVIFAGPAEPLLPQRIYTFDNAGIGQFDLFIVPIGREAGGIRYQAAFTRVIKQTQTG